MPLRHAVAVLCSVILLAPSLLAVGTTGTVVGTVTDPTGAVIAGAQVTVRNSGTNAACVVQTNATGDYSVPLLPPGPYEVTVEAKGFRKSLFSDVKLEVDQTVRVDASMSRRTSG